MRKLFVGLAVAGLLAAGCGGDDSEDETVQDAVTDETAGDGGAEGDAGADAEGDLGIIISSSKFDPNPLETEGGTVTLTVTNDDSFPHTFTTDDGSVDEEVGGGDAVEVEVEVPEGEEVPYHCEIHPSMTGTITG